jgi:hypothetical protein
MAAAAVLALASVAVAFQGEPAAPKQAAGDTKAADKQMYDALREVILTGRDLFNKQGDYSGCFRVFQGSLIAVKPLLGHRPDLQKAIDKGMADAEQMSYMHQRAFALRKVLDTVRAGLKSGEAAAEATEKLPTPPPPEPIEPKKGEEKPQAEKASVLGKVLYKGMPLPAGTISFHKAKDVYAGKINADGTYALDVPPGSYLVAIETASAKKGAPEKYVAIPQAYADPMRSPFMVEVKAGKNTFDIELK